MTGDWDGCQCESCRQAVAAVVAMVAARSAWKVNPIDDHVVAVRFASRMTDDDLTFLDQAGVRL